MAKKKPDSETEDLHADAMDAFERIAEVEADNRETFKGDIEFARAGEQWPEAIRKEREKDGRPCLTINKMNAFIRQVVNDARQNKPSIKCKPVDDRADVETAKVLEGLFRNIEHISNADVAYDTASENAVAGGFGYIRVAIDYAADDAFEQDILIERVANPLSVYGDPDSTAADSSDWEQCFVVDRYTKAQFERRWGDKAQVDWDDEAWSNSGSNWRDGETSTVAEYWHCTYEKVRNVLVQDVRDGSKHVYEASKLQESPDLADLLGTGLMTVLGEREMRAKRFEQVIMTGVEILERNKWPGRYIPLIPVYGDEYWIEGRRFLRSLIHQARDAQMMYNFWRTNSTELVALAPRVPFIGPRGAFDNDVEKWSSANTRSHAYLEYDGNVPPQRQPLDFGVAAGSLQEALNASDDMKAITGLYDASLGARSNETSGRAIMARQREGDIATFHFQDNLSRAIRHTAKVVLDLVPHVYNKARIIRVLGEDGSEKTVPVNQEAPKIDDETGEPETDDMGNVIMQMHDLTVGKYDVVVSAGPSFTTRREEAAMQMTELVRAFPQAAPFIADIMAKNFDWPGADEIAERFKAMNPAQQQQGLPPQVMEGLQKMQQRLAELEQENQQLKQKHGIEQFKAQTGQYEAETKRIQTEAQIGMDVINVLTPQPVMPQGTN